MFDLEIRNKKQFNISIYEEWVHNRMSVAPYFCAKKWIVKNKTEYYWGYFDTRTNAYDKYQHHFFVTLAAQQENV